MKKLFLLLLTAVALAALVQFGRPLLPHCWWSCKLVKSSEKLP